MLMAVRVVPAAAVSVAAAGGATTDGVPSLESGGVNHDVLGLAAVQQERGLRGEKPGPEEEPRVGEVKTGHCPPPCGPSWIQPTIALGANIRRGDGVLGMRCLVSLGWDLANP